MKKIALMFMLMFVLSGVCSAQKNEFTYLGQSNGVAAFLYNEDIHVKGELYMFHTVVRNTNNSTTTVFTVIANKKEQWFVHAGATVELPDGSRQQSSGDATRRYFDKNSPVGRAIYCIDSKRYLT